MFKLSCDDSGDRATIEEQFEQAAQVDQVEQGECDDVDRRKEDIGQRW